MITNNFRLGVNDSFQYTQSDQYVNIEGIKQHLNPIATYRTDYAIQISSRISPWIFSEYPCVWGGSRQTSSGYCDRNQLIRWFPSKATSSFYVPATNSEGYSSTFIGFGSGTTAPTPQDYNLEKPLYASFKFSQVCTTGTTDDTRYYTNRKLLITNSQSDSFTISELGLFIPVYTAGNISGVYISTYSPTQNQHVEVYMLERTVLDTPITLAYNETTSIDYRIVVNLSFD